MKKRQFAKLTRLEGMIENPKESSSRKSTAPEFMLKVYPRTFCNNKRKELLIFLPKVYYSIYLAIIDFLPSYLF